MANQLLELKMNFNLAGENILNVFYYEMDNAESTSDETMIDIGIQFETDILAGIQGWAEDSLLFGQLNMRTLLEDVAGALPREFVYDPTITNGIFSGDRLPTHDALSYTLTNNNPLIRNGAKRFAGVPEALNINGTVDPGFPGIGSVLILETNLASPLLARAGEVDETNLLPVVVKRIPYLAPDQTPVPGGTPGASYRLPTTVSEYVPGYVDDAILKTFLSTQNSRKQGITL